MYASVIENELCVTVSANERLLASQAEVIESRSNPLCPGAVIQLAGFEEPELVPELAALTASVAPENSGRTHSFMGRVLVADSGDTRIYLRRSSLGADRHREVWLPLSSVYAAGHDRRRDGSVRRPFPQSGVHIILAELRPKSAKALRHAKV